MKNNLSQYLAYVRRGGAVRVFDRDVPIADLVPLSPRPERASAADAIVDDLERKGVVTRGTGKLPYDFIKRQLPKPHASVLAALLEERSEGR